MEPNAEGRVFLVAICLAVSWVGLWYHELVRVPQWRGITPEGTVLMGIIAIAVVVSAIRRPGSRLWFRVAAAYGVVSLVGAVLTAPLSELVGTRGAHFYAHVVYAIFQLPLTTYTLGVRRWRQRQSSDGPVIS